MNGLTGKLSHMDNAELYYTLNMVAGNSALDQLQVNWLDDRTSNSLGDKEIVVPLGVLDHLYNATLFVGTINATNIESVLGVSVSGISSDVLNGIVSYVNNQIGNSEVTYQQFYNARLSVISGVQLAKARLWTNSAFVSAMEHSHGGGFASRNWNSYTDYQNWDFCRYAYRNNLDNPYNGGYVQNAFGDLTGGQVKFDSFGLAAEKDGTTLSALLGKFVFSAMKQTWNEYSGQQEESPFATYEEWTIAGLYNSTGGSSTVISDAFYDAYRDYAFSEGFSVQDVAYHKSGVYAFCLAPMPTNAADIEQLVRMSYEEGVDILFSLQNQVMTTLETFNQFVEPGAKIFLYVGLGFALFSALLLMNFIATSIAYKKREIGILRAVGARSSDVFKIFFSESFIIAMINYVLALVAAFLTVFFLNRWMRGEGINVTLLNFGARQALLMLGISILVALLSSFLPVYKIARRKPVDAIKDR